MDLSSRFSYKCHEVYKRHGETAVALNSIFKNMPCLPTSAVINTAVKAISRKHTFTLTKIMRLSGRALNYLLKQNSFT